VSDEYDIGRHVANLFVTQTYEGQSDIHSERATPKRTVTEKLFFLTGKINFRPNPWEGNHGNPSVLLVESAEGGTPRITCPTIVFVFVFHSIPLAQDGG
jgi:hypothetical protein